MSMVSASAVIGTTATVMAVLLLLLRIKIDGNRHLLALIRWWIGLSPRTSGVALAFLFTIAGACIVDLTMQERRRAASVPAPAASPSVTSPIQFAFVSGNSGSEVHDLSSLRSYVDSIGGTSQSAASAAETASPGLPDVDSMIAKLFARLKDRPDDVKGWKMLGWSYLNTNRWEEAARAYETALRLDPSDTEIQKGLETAKSAQPALANTTEPKMPVTGNQNAVSP